MLTKMGKMWSDVNNLTALRFLFSEKKLKLTMKKKTIQAISMKYISKISSYPLDLI